MSIPSILLTLIETPTTSSLSVVNTELLHHELLASIPPTASGPFEIVIAPDYFYISYSSPNPTLLLSVTNCETLKTDGRLDLIFQRTLSNPGPIVFSLKNYISPNATQIRAVSYNESVFLKVVLRAPQTETTENYLLSIAPNISST